MALRWHHQLVASCSPDFIWRAFEDVSRWPDWNAVIGRAAWVQGQPWQRDSKLHIEIVNPTKLTLEPVVLGSAPPNLTHWTGKGKGVKAEILFRFDKQADGGTTMQVWEEFSGAATLLVTDRMKRDIVAVFDHWLQSLKAEGERLAQVSSPAATRRETH